MLPSLYSAISGLKANQKKLDVIGNNIANSSTTGFKSQTVKFKDMLSQGVGEASGAAATTGGINPKQIGLGVQIGAIDTNTKTGDMQSTGSNLDAAIDGNGYFMVGKGLVPQTNGDGVAIDTTNHVITDSKGMNIMYSKDGSFTLDNKGNLLTSDGNRILGYALTASGGSNSIEYTGGVPTINYVNPDDASFAAGNTLVPLVIPDAVKDSSGNELRVKSFTIEKNGLIKAVLDGGSVTALGQIAVASFKNDAGLTKLGNNLYRNSANSGDAVIRSGAGSTSDNGNGYGDVLQGMLEMSNVDLAEQFTDMIVASRAFQANGKIITTGDEILQELVNLKR